MWAIIIPLISSLIGEKGPLGQYFKIKSDQVQADQEFKLALLKSQTEASIAQSVADTTQRSNYLNATSSGFRQGTFYWISAIILYSILFPNKAEALWYNFSLIPQWVQYIYLGMLSVTWGLPIAKENIGLMFSSIGRGMSARRDFKLEKAKLDRDVIFKGIRNDIFPKGMTQTQVDSINKALDLGEGI